MSWIGGLNDSLNQITSKAGQFSGQLTSFTKEVLAESTEEDADYEAQASALKDKLSNAEVEINQYKAQVEEQQQNILELEEQCRRSELDAHSRVCEYEARLEKQQKLLNKLKHESASGDDFQIITDGFGRVSSSGSSRDADDFADVITYQREVSRLRSELEFLEEENGKWKAIAENSQLSTGEDNSLVKVKELELRLHQTIDKHQQEYIELQQANASTVQQLQDEIRTLRSRISSGEREPFVDVSDQSKQKQELLALKAENEEAKEKLRNKNRQLQLQKKNINNLQAELQNVKKHRDDVSSQVETLQSEIDALKTERNNVQAQLSSDLEKLNHSFKDLNEVIVADGHSDDCSHDEIVRHVKALHEARDKQRDEITSLKKQIELAEKEKYELVETMNDGSFPSLEANLRKKIMPLHQSSPAPDRSKPDDSYLIVSSPSEDETFPGDVTVHQLQALQKQVAEYESEISEYQSAMKKWNEEKESFQVMLTRFQNEVSDDEDSSKPDDDNNAVSETASSLKKEVSTLREARSAMEKDKEKLYQEIEQIRSAMAILQGRLDESLAENVKEKDHVTVLKAELESVTSQKTRLEADVQSISADLDASRSERNELDQSIVALDEQHEEAMGQLLEIRREVDQKLKDAESELKAATAQIKDLQSANQLVNEKLQSGADELKNVREELNAAVDEKQSLKTKVENVDASLQAERKRYSVAETNFKKLEDALKNVEEERKTLQNKVASLEEEIKISYEEEEKNLIAVEEFKSRLIAIEAEKEKAESEQERVTSELARFEHENKQLENELDLLQQESIKVKEENTSLLASRDTELNRLQFELNTLKDEGKKRIEQLTQQSSSEASSHVEITSLKNELVIAHEKLEKMNETMQNLKDDAQKCDLKIQELERDLLSKEEKSNDLSEQLVRAENEKQELENVLDSYKSKLTETNELHEQEVAKLREQLDEQSFALNEDLEAKLKQMLLKCEENINEINEEKADLEHENKTLLERVKYMEENVSVEMESMRESLHDQAAKHQAEKHELEYLTESLQKELERKRLQIENLEEDFKKQMDLQQDENRRKEEKYLLEHSESLNEKSTLKTAFDEEKNQLLREHSALIEQLKMDYENLMKNAEDSHAKEMASEISNIKNDFYNENFSLTEQVSVLKEELESKNADLIRTRDDLKVLSLHFQKEEEEWRQESAAMLEKLKLDHQEELALAKSESDEMIQLNMHQAGSISNELVESQMSSLQEEIEHLRTELEKSRTEVKEKKSVELDLKLQSTELKDANDRLSALQAHNEELEANLHEANEENRKLKVTTTSLPQTSDVDTKSTDKLLKEGRDILSNLPDSDIRESLARDLEGLEKADLSKDDISSLLALIKERDNVISILYESNNTLTSQLKSKTTSDSADRLKQMQDEKEQIMSVISDKTKENRQLKDEIRKMVDVIAANNNALSKLQEENQKLISKYEGFDQEMTKETVARLSKLISEKDLEIESLRQKCQTLLDVLQQQDQRQDASNPSGSGISPQQVEVLLKERETLGQQVRQLLAERNHLVALVHSKHQEALAFHEKAQKAAESLEADAAENSRLQILYSNLVHDYEQIQLKLSTVVKELSRFKESLNDIEESKEILFNKLDIVDSSPTPDPNPQTSPDVSENIQSDSSKASITKTKEELERIVDKNSESLLQKDVLLLESSDRIDTFTKQISQLQVDIREKDILIHKKSKTVTQLNDDVKQKSNEINILRKSVENLREQISSSSQDASSLNERLDVAERKLLEKESESHAFQETNAQLSVMLKEREYELESLREKVVNLQTLLQQYEQGKTTESQKYLKELDRANEQATSAKHERDQIMLTLKQKQIETQRASDEARSLREKEVKLHSELTRLRSHLVQMEETYTQEAVLSNDRELALRERLEQIEIKTSSAFEENELTKQQLESLQDQVRTATQQRDQAIHNFQLAKEQSTQYASALQQLQMAAERMQKEEAATYAARVEKINQQFQVKEEENRNLSAQVKDLNSKLEDVNIVLESASRLNEQLEIKERLIDQLKHFVSEKQLEIEELQDELHKLNTKSENLVDRQLVKNLLIGYFNSPVNKQNDVIRLISSMIGFTKEEESRLFPSKKGWVTGWLSWGRGSGPPDGGPKSPKSNQLNESFTDMFVKFLESESTARQPAAKLPAAAMVNDTQLRMNQRKTAAKAGSLPLPVFNPPRDGETSERSTVAGRYNPLLVTSPHTTGSSQSSHLLMQPLGAMLPTFAPVASSKSSERDILENILHDNEGE